jgi:drug/metabolite transporter (DMT)-like permease
MTWFLIATCSALLSASAAVMQKKVLRGLAPLEFSFLLSGIILLFSAAAFVTADPLSVPPATLAVIVGKSLLGGVAFLCVMSALAEGPISGVLPLLGLTPAVTALFSLLLTGESLLFREWGGIFLMIVGTTILEAGGREKGILAKRHLLIGAALCLFAISSVIDRMLVTGFRVDPGVVLFYQHAVYCALFGVLVLLGRKSLRGLVAGGRAHLPLLLGIAVATLGYRWTQLEAMTLAPAALVLAVKRTSILYASAYGGKFFHDEGLGTRLLGAALIIGAGFMILRNVL